MAATEFAAGATLNGDRYRLERRLGAGGMASVWLARDERLGRPVAIKALSDLLADDPDYVRRFQREARVAAGLSHPALVRVFDFGDVPRPYLVMEYLPCGTLAEHLRDHGPIKDPEALARTLLEALAHVHAGRIVHRDVKPGNVLLDRENHPRLTDFGIAQPEDASRLTQTGGVLGTMRYLAPEVLHGAPATPSSDLYSLGVLLRECAGEVPRGRLATLIERLTADDPADRPESAGRGLDLLESRVAEPEPTATTGRIMPSAREVIRDVLPRPRNPLPVRELADGGREYEIRFGKRGGAILLFILLAIGGVILLSTGGDKTAPRTPASKPDAPLSRQLDGLDRDVRRLR